MIINTDTERIYTQVTQNILDEYGNGQRYTYEVKSALMGFQSAAVAERIVEVYNLPVTPNEYTALTRTKEHLDLMGAANVLPGNAISHTNFTNRFLFFFSLYYIPYYVRVNQMCTSAK